MTPSISVAVADDAYLFQDGIATHLSRHEDMKVVFVRSVDDELLELVHKHKPDVFILGIPEGTYTAYKESVFDIPEVFARLQKEKTEVIVLSERWYYEKEYVPFIVQSGVRAYLLKEDEMTLNLPEIARNIYQDKEYTYFSDEIARILADDSDVSA